MELANFRIEAWVGNHFEAERLKVDLAEFLYRHASVDDYGVELIENEKEKGK